jgi:hypothetical protein
MTANLVQAGAPATVLRPGAKRTLGASPNGSAHFNMIQKLRSANTVACGIQPHGVGPAPPANTAARFNTG